VKAVLQGTLDDEVDNPQTWGEFCDLYFEKHVKARNLNFDSEIYKFNVLKERWKNKPLSEVIQPKYLDDFLAEKKNLKPSSRNRYRERMRSMLNFAFRRKLIKENPFLQGAHLFEKEKNQRAVRLNREQ